MMEQLQNTLTEVTDMADWCIQVVENCPIQATVSVQQANDLYNADFGGASDPYCIVKIKDLTKRREAKCAFETDVIFNNLNPVWNHVETVRLAEGQSILFQVWDRDSSISDDELLGEIWLHPQDFLPSGFAGTVNLQGGISPEGKK